MLFRGHFVPHNGKPLMHFLSNSLPSLTLLCVYRKGQNYTTNPPMPFCIMYRPSQITLPLGQESSCMLQHLQIIYNSTTIPLVSNNYIQQTGLCELLTFFHKYSIDGHKVQKYPKLNVKSTQSFIYYSLRRILIFVTVNLLQGECSLTLVRQ